MENDDEIEQILSEGRQEMAKQLAGLSDEEKFNYFNQTAKRVCEREGFNTVEVDDGTRNN